MRKVTVSYNTATEAKQMVTSPGLLRMDAMLPLGLPACMRTTLISIWSVK